jgi:hypothetical protein
MTALWFEHPHTLAFLAGINQVRATHPGVTRSASPVTSTACTPTTASTPTASWPLRPTSYATAPPCLAHARAKASTPDDLQSILKSDIPMSAEVTMPELARLGPS